MKKRIFTSLLLTVLTLSAFSTRWEITNAGFAFTPATLSISAGDSVNFSIASMHDAVEVSQSTWDANGITPLAGGFSLPLGGGLINPVLLTAGIHYYVCTTHVGSFGMKGTIVVSEPPGWREESMISGIELFPNPTRDIVLVTPGSELNGLTYYLKDQSGKLLLSGTITDKRFTIDLTSYASGVYYLQIPEKRRPALKIIKY
jgi:plastocyanin